MDCKKLAEGILEKVGGKENIESVVHCMTRLRFVLKDENLADDDQVKKNRGSYRSHEEEWPIPDYYW